MPSLVPSDVARFIRAAVDYLHDEAHIIHTGRSCQAELLLLDLQPNNLLMGINDKSVLSKYETDELEHPAPRKLLADRAIYPSRPLPTTFGPPALCDLGEARLGDKEHQDDIMPDVYKAPEVIVGMKWGYTVDIWIVEFVSPFQSRPCKYDDAYHLAQMVAVLGPPPLEFLKRSPHSLKYWDENDTSLEKLEKRLTGVDKDRFFLETDALLEA
ncbi:hypothetical protein FQN57_003106 [Myotisia sp. PD_48]|nr:hypothetical protein FQN57_003106 [Myotisia sp. PD_48]